MLNLIKNDKIAFRNTNKETGSIDKMEMSKIPDVQKTLERAVRILTNYTDYEISLEEFIVEFNKILPIVKENKNQFPAWIIELIEKYEIVDSDKACESDDYLFQTEFDYQIIKQLQALRITGSYLDIIKNDYSEYI